MRQVHFSLRGMLLLFEHSRLRKHFLVLIIGIVLTSCGRYQPPETAVQWKAGSAAVQADPVQQERLLFTVPENHPSRWCQNTA